MFNTKKIIAAAVMMGASFAFTPAEALTNITYKFNFSGSDGTGTATAIGTIVVAGGVVSSGSGILTATDLPILHDTINLAGTTEFGGGTVLSTDNGYPLDNTGIVFSDANSPLDVGFNIWSNGGNSFTGFIAGNPAAPGDGIIYNAYNGTFTATALPEPAVWAMMLLGFGGIGFMLRNSRRQQSRFPSIA